MTTTTKISGNKEIANQIASLFAKAGINVIEVGFFGSRLIVESYEKYNDKIQHALTSAGFEIVKAIKSNVTGNFTIGAKMA